MLFRQGNHILMRKEGHSPEPKQSSRRCSPTPSAPSGKAPCLASLNRSLPGSLTVEASVALPVFLVCMVAVLQIMTVLATATKLDGAMTQTGEEMAAAAYVQEYGEGSDIITAVITDGFATARTFALAGERPGIRHENFLLSTFMQDDDMVNLVLTYQMKPTVGMVRIPWTWYMQVAGVRGWSGRKGSAAQKEEKKDGEEAKGEKVFVTDNRSVYHTDPNCTHLRLKIESVSASEVDGRRNDWGKKYHACEYCATHGKSGTLFITPEGDCYHTNLDCSGLKRTVHEVDKHDVEDLKPCSRCGGRR